MSGHTDTGRLREVAQLMHGEEYVDGFSLIKDDGRVDGPALEITVSGAYDRVPPRLCSILGRHDTGIWYVGQQGGSFVVVAV